MALVGVVGAVALIGNLRAAGSNAAVDLVTADTHAPSGVDCGGRPASARTGVHSAIRGKDIRVQDEARLVPAIYAWDPDVRFVYYRHVSKWM